MDVFGEWHEGDGLSQLMQSLTKAVRRNADGFSKNGRCGGDLLADFFRIGGAGPPLARAVRTAVAALSLLQNW
jgi:hypothetical protein